MNISQLINTRLINQQIGGTAFTTPLEMVSWMGAMQAQDFAMSKWALGLRLKNSSEEKIEDAIDKGEIIRTHVLRPTWHFVSAEDIHWMLALTAANIKTSTRSREKFLEMTEPIFSKAYKTMQKVLQGGNHLTREALMLHLKKAKINTSEQRGIHFLLRAELDGIVCSGITKAKKHTYALLDERVPVRKKIDRDEALATLAAKYFQSHGPATLQDFIWWSGLRVKDARDALEMVKSNLNHETIDAKTWWFSNKISFEKSYDKSVYTLPAFDEYLVSYKDRAAMMALENQRQVATINGILNPVIVVNGKVCALWSRTFQKDKVMIATNFFKPPPKNMLPLIKKSFKTFGSFVNKKVVVELG